MKLRENSDGITLVELVIVMTITGIVMIAVLSFAIDFWGNSATLQNDSSSLADRNDTGDRLREQLNTAQTLIIQNSLGDAHPMIPDPADSTGLYWEPIHAIPGNFPVGSSGTYTSLIYFESPATDSSKNIIFNGVNPYLNEYVIYLDGTTKQMLLRTIANTAATNNTAIASCPASAATSSCPSDKILASNVDSVDMRYFSRTGNLIDHQSITDSLTGEYIGPDFTSVEVVEFNIHSKIKATIGGSQETINQTIVRVALRNG